MPFYYLLPALGGQVTNLPSGSLTFTPPGLQPNEAFSLPFFIAGAGGSVSRDVTGTVTLALHYGSLVLPAGGLVVAGVPYSQPVDLAPGTSISWA